MQVCSLLLTNTEELEGEILPLLTQVVEGRGCDIPAIKRLINHCLTAEEKDRFAYEVDRCVHMSSCT